MVRVVFFAAFIFLSTITNAFNQCDDGESLAETRIANLIQEFSCETITKWTNVVRAKKDGTTITDSPVHGKYMCTIGGAAATASQSINIAVYSVGQIFQVGVSILTKTSSTLVAIVQYQWLDHNNEIIGVPQELSHSGSTWSHKNQWIAKPLNAITLRVVMMCDQPDVQCDGVFDGFYVGANLVVNPDGLVGSYNGAYPVDDSNPVNIPEYREPKGWTASGQPWPINDDNPPNFDTRLCTPDGYGPFRAHPHDTDIVTLTQTIHVSSFSSGTVFYFRGLWAAATAGSGSKARIFGTWKFVNNSLSLTNVGMGSCVTGCQGPILLPASSIVTMPADAKDFIITLQANGTTSSTNGVQSYFDQIVFVPSDAKPIISPSTVTFGIVHKQSGKQTQTVTITNAGALTNINWILASLTGAGLSSYTFSRSFATTPPLPALAPLESISFTVTFDPAVAIGTRLGSVSVTQSGEPAITYTIPLSGTSTDQLAVFSLRTPASSTTPKVLSGDYVVDKGQLHYLTSNTDELLEVTNLGTETDLVLLTTTRTATPAGTLNAFQAPTLSSVPADNTNVRPFASSSDVIQTLFTTRAIDKAYGQHEAKYRYKTNDPLHPDVSITLRVYISNQKMVMSQTAFTFGEVHKLLPEKTLSITFTNTGTFGNLYLKNIAITNVAYFVITTSAADVTLGPGETHTMSVMFLHVTNGVIAGARTASLTFKANDPIFGSVCTNCNAGQCDCTVPVSGTGADFKFEMTPTTHDFIQQHYFTGPLDTTVTFKNTGTVGTLSINTFANLPPFVFSDNAAFNLAPGASKTLTLSLAPDIQYLGLNEKAFTFVTNDPAHLTNTMSVKGIVANFQAVLTSPVSQSIDFGSVHIGAGAAPTQNVVITNSGAHGWLQFNSIAITGTAQSTVHFSVASGGETGSNAANVLLGGNSRTIVLKFDPSATSVQWSAQLVIECNDKNKDNGKITFTINLKGKATDETPHLSSPTLTSLTGHTWPTPKDIDETDPGNFETFLITNTGTLGSLSVTSIVLEGDTADFLLTSVSQPAAVLKPYVAGCVPDNECFIRVFVKFFPKSVGTRVAYVSFYNSHHSDNPYKLKLEGQGTHPLLSVLNPTIDFGSWDITRGQKPTLTLPNGSIRHYIPLKVKNVGSTALHITKLLIMTPDPGAYTFTPVPTTATPVTVAVGATTEFNVMFDPVAPNGDQPATLQITSDEYLHPTALVSLKGQATLKLSAVSGQFVPPFAAHPTELRLTIVTTDIGLPKNGKIGIGFPDGFTFFPNLEATVRGPTATFGPAVSVDTSTSTVMIDMSTSGFTGKIEKGATISVTLKNLQLPSAEICESYAAYWEFNVTTWDADTDLVEYNLKSQVPGIVCVQPKYFNYTLTPPGVGNILQAGLTTKFSIHIPPGSAAVMERVGIDRINTKKDKDQAKIISADKSCFDPVSEPEGAYSPFTYDLGEGDDLQQLMATWDVGLFSGMHKLCYLQYESTWGWEQVGQPFLVYPRAIPGDPDLTVYPAYVPYGVTTPETVMTVPWLTFSPNIVSTYETIIYHIGGATSWSERILRFRLSATDKDCEGFPPGVPAEGIEMSEMNTVAFTVNEAGLYRMCVKFRFDWEPLENWVWVRRIPTANVEILDGFRTCQGFIESAISAPTGRCGCWHGTGERAITFRTTAESPSIVERLAALGSNSFTVNQGCCTQRSSTRSEAVGTDPLPWGYCAEAA